MSETQDNDDDEGPASSEADEALPKTKEMVLRFLREERPKEIFYMGQLEVIFEDRKFLKTPWGMRAPFHWITSKALAQLAAEGRISSERDPQESAGLNPMRFFHAKSHRDWRLQAREIHGLMEEMSRPNFNHGVGRQAEIMFDSALAGDFNVAAEDTNEWNGAKWTKTNENLDRIYVHKDGTAYGCEIKNTLPYIELGEFERKLEMCAELKVRPLFIARMMPEIYIQRVWKKGGYSLVYKNQFYPFGFEDLAQRVRRRMELPVICARSVPQGDVGRFASWHEKQRQRTVDFRMDPQDPPPSH